MDEARAIRLVSHQREDMGLKGDATAFIRGLLRKGHGPDAIIDAYAIAADRGVRRPEAWVAAYFKRERGEV